MPLKLSIEHHVEIEDKRHKESASSASTEEDESSKKSEEAKADMVF